MTLDQLAFLKSDIGQQWLAKLGAAQISDATHLRWAMQLRQVVGADNAHALLETALLRQRATKKFSRAAQMYFDRPGLEMSSAELIATYRAQKFAPFANVADLGCGIGGDAIGFASVTNVIGVDRDDVRLQMARDNVGAYGHAARFEGRAGDLIAMQPFTADALFFDPARRTPSGKRIFKLAAYQPPITLLHRWQTTTPHWGIKISPGVDYADLPAEAHVEFVSFKGELREAILWYGALRPAAKRSATLLRDSGVVAQFDSNSAEKTEIAPTPQAYLYDPDPAVIRAQLITQLAARLDAAQLDPTIAYLTCDTAHQTPLARRFTVEAWLPFQLKTLRRYLRERSVGRVVIKKRGSPLEPDQLRKQLKLRGTQKRTLFLTRGQAGPIVIISPSSDAGD